MDILFNEELSEILGKDDSAKLYHVRILFHIFITNVVSFYGFINIVFFSFFFCLIRVLYIAYLYAECFFNQSC